MQTENARNTVIFIVCAVALLIVYQIFVLDPATRKQRAEQQRAAAAAEVQPGTTRPGTAPGAVASSVYVDRTQARSASPRVPVDTPYLAGTLSLRGGRIDDLYLKQYRETLAADSPNVELFRPQGAQHAYFAQFGWAGENLPGLPGPNTVWTLTEGDVLRPGRPVTLRHDNGAGLVFTRRISVDERYMFTVADTVANTGGRPVELAAYGSVQRHGLPPGLANNMILHEGAIGVTRRPEGGERVVQETFKDWRKEGDVARPSTGGWFGITDKYWLAAVIPDQTEAVRSNFRVTPSGGVDIYEAVFVGPERTIAPGRQVTESTRLFAGAKRDEILDAYGAQLNLPRFDMAIDWGNFWMFTRPIFWLLEAFYKLVGNFGVAILLLTVVVKAIFFPLANKSFESMTKMKKLAPKMQELKEKHPDDPAKVQQGMLALYQQEKVNPLMGCLPLLVQIPVFYALYKVLFVTLEMRHAPFVGFIRDLSARDPTYVWNLFGLLPFNPAAVPLIGSILAGFLGIGVLAIIYGFTMWLQQSMNPPAPDPIQQRMFQLFPFIFTFIMAPFAAGLLIYWIWNNVLSILQQYVIMRRFKVENPIDNLLGRLSGKPKPA
jgi:YidC/Oxa1 family membrane protein insertase